MTSKNKSVLMIPIERIRLPIELFISFERIRFQQVGIEVRTSIHQPIEFPLNEMIEEWACSRKELKDDESIDLAILYLRNSLKSLASVSREIKNEKKKIAKRISKSADSLKKRNFNPDRLV